MLRRLQKQKYQVYDLWANMIIKGLILNLDFHILI